jgi:hypothetical protein
MAHPKSGVRGLENQSQIPAYSDEEKGHDPLDFIDRKRGVNNS